MVDVDRFVDLLARVTQRVAILRGYEDVDAEELLADRVRMSDVKYTFQTAIEACIDAAHHVLASEGLGRPTTNRAAFTQLADADVIPRELAERMADAVGFRNVLVHGYAEVDDHRVVAHLDDLDALDRFVDAMAALID